MAYCFERVIQNICSKCYLALLVILEKGMRNKNIMDIISLILDVANQENDLKGNSSTIMYRALFDQPQLREFWNALIVKGLLKFDSKTKTFKSTEKGLAFLQDYEKMARHRTKKRAYSSLPA